MFAVHWLTQRLTDPGKLAATTSTDLAVPLVASDSTDLAKHSLETASAAEPEAPAATPPSLALLLTKFHRVFGEDASS